MALIKGMLLSFDNPLLGLIPTIVLFQYNPTEVTRVFTSEAPAGGSGPKAGAALAAPKPAMEDYSIKLELDATDGLEKEAPLTSALGLGPRLAALEMLMQPVGSSLLGGLLGGLLGRGGATIPAGKLPVVLFAWGPARVTPVRLKSLTIRETSFDELLNPIHATADLGLTVLRKEDLAAGETLARAAADFYKGAREVKAVLSIPQMIELA
ncbi:MAG: hypothetical protein ACR2KK_02755 [Acidimicrobiales bacterium]